uniref:Uncharacterized protein n=1 Tax=Arundo donax TaxID=35708 RepID=A0A0A9FG15_ARUDO
MPQPGAAVPHPGGSSISISINMCGTAALVIDYDESMRCLLFISGVTSELSRRSMSCNIENL